MEGIFKQSNASPKFFYDPDLNLVFFYDKNGKNLTCLEYTPGIFPHIHEDITPLPICSTGIFEVCMMPKRGLNVTERVIEKYI